MADSKKITELTASLPSGPFDFAVASGVENYKISYSDLSEYSSIGTKSGNFTEALTIKGVPVTTGTSEPATASGLRWSGVPATSSSPGESGNVAHDTGYFYVCTTGVATPSVAVTDIFASSSDHFFLTAAGDVYGYGYNDEYQLGLGDTDQRDAPTYITGLNEGSAVTDISLANYTSLLLTPAGDAYGCGRNDDGQLGLGDTVQRSVPTYITGLSEGSAVTGLPRRGGDAWGEASLFLTPAGDVYGCGKNGDGELGLGDYTQREVPTLITGLSYGSAVTGIFSVSWNSFFLTPGGDAYGCGLNNNHLLGLGPHTLSTQTYPSPMYITGTTVADISTSHEHTMFLTTAGDVYANGQNGFAELGDGTTTTRDWPTYITGLSQGTAVTDILSTNYHSFFLTAAGNVYGCGLNGQGQLGLGDTTQREVPTLITGGVTNFCGGLGTTSFLTAAGDVYSCGVASSLGFPVSHPNILSPTYITGAGSPAAGGPWRRLSLSTWEPPWSSNLYSVDITQGETQLTQYLSMASPITLSGPKTISIWAKASSNWGAGYGGVFLSDATMANYAVLVQSTPVSPAYMYYKGNSVGQYHSLGLGFFIVGDWYHLVLTSDGTTANYYANNATSGAAANASFGTDPDVTFTDLDRIGKAGNYQQKSNVDEIAVWDIELSAAQITNIYRGESNGGAGGTNGQPGDLSSFGASGPLHWWRMGDNDGGVGMTVTDQGSAQNNLTLQNFTAPHNFSTVVP
jgi:alpha-tubulin suppressor-like RCC1 family protein